MTMENFLNPTRITLYSKTCFDNIFTNFPPHSSSTFETGHSDHLANVLTFSLEVPRDDVCPVFLMLLLDEESKVFFLSCGWRRSVSNNDYISNFKNKIKAVWELWLGRVEKGKIKLGLRK